MADIENIQALVVRSPVKPLIAVLLFKLGDAATARQFLREYAPKLLRGHPTLDVEQGRRSLEVFFTDSTQAPGSLAMAQQLGFVGGSAPEGWWEGRFPPENIDLAVYACFDADQKAQALAELREAAARCGLQELKLSGFDDGALAGVRPRDGRLHFGYRDGITTPDIDWSDGGRPGSVDLREILLGYPNSDYPTSPLRPGPWQDFARAGSHVALA